MLPQKFLLWVKDYFELEVNVNRYRKCSLPSPYLPKNRSYTSLTKVFSPLHSRRRNNPYPQGQSTEMSLHKQTLRSNFYLPLDSPIYFSSVQSLSRVWLFVTPWTAAHQASLSITNSQSLLKLMSIKSVMPSNHLILCRPLLLPPSIFPSTRVFSSESALHIKRPKDWSFSFSINPSNEYSGLISFRMDWLHPYI